MNLADAKQLGIKHRGAKRYGRGIGSGHGKTSGRGHKGAKARSGYSGRIGWEGGQMPLYRRVPKRGFNNKNFRKFFTIINVADLNSFEAGSVVDLATVLQAGLVSKEKGGDLFKVLGHGTLERALTIRVDAITGSARAKVEAAGGKVELIPTRQYRPKFTRRDGSVSTPGGAGPRAKGPARS
jgi:large subunit ribosomal protein L15